jgi:hypothetical protein
VQVMTSAMKGMVKALPVEERKELLLRMMPDMMRQADMVKMMPNMLRDMSSLITLYSLYTFVRALADDEEALETVKDSLEKAKVKMPAMMEQMHSMMLPLMTGVMSGFMPKMMALMSPMMPTMKEVMPQVMDGAMIPMLEQKPEVRKHMLEMMQTMFPHCAENMFPLIEEEQRRDFIDNLQGIMSRAAGPEAGPEQEAPVGQ